MARVLSRHKFTIFREIKRNFWADDAFLKNMLETLEWLPTNLRNGGDQRSACCTTSLVVSARWEPPRQIGNRMIDDRVE